MAKFWLKLGYSYLKNLKMFSRLIPLTVLYPMAAFKSSAAASSGPPASEILRDAMAETKSILSGEDQREAKSVELRQDTLADAKTEAARQAHHGSP